MDDFPVKGLRIPIITRDSKPFEAIREILGRRPNQVELAVFSVCWSRRADTAAFTLGEERDARSYDRVLRAPDATAGAVDLGNGQAAVVNISSIDGILDGLSHFEVADPVGSALCRVIVHGARPVGLVHHLCLPEGDGRTAHVLAESLGIHANMMGVPSLECNLVCDDTFDGRYAACSLAVGTISTKRLTAAPTGDARRLMLLTQNRCCRRPATDVEKAADASKQGRLHDVMAKVGDPFEHHMMADGVMALLRARVVTRVWDLSRAGLAWAAIEAGLSQEKGVELDLSGIPADDHRPEFLAALLSSQPQGCLILCADEKIDEIRRLLAERNLEVWEVGHTTAEDALLVRDFDGRGVAKIPIKKIYDWNDTEEQEGRGDEAGDDVHTVDFRHTREDGHPDPGNALKRILSGGNGNGGVHLSSHFDQTIRADTLATADTCEANVVALRNTGKALAMTLLSLPRLCAMDPEIGATRSVEFAARRLSCCGARALGLTIGVAPRPSADDGFRMNRMAAGLAKAATALDIPILSRSVARDHAAVDRAHPIPMIASIGFLEEASLFAQNGFHHADLHIFLLGKSLGDLSASQYVVDVFGGATGKLPELDLDEALRLHRAVSDAVASGWVRHARVVGSGGLALALARSCLAPEGIGVRAVLSDAMDIASQLFDELSVQVIVGVKTHDRAEFVRFTEERDVPCNEIGITGGTQLVVSAGGQIQLALSIEELKAARQSSSPNLPL